MGRSRSSGVKRAVSSEPLIACLPIELIFDFACESLISPEHLRHSIKGIHGQEPGTTQGE
jgi:hypothetical protein